MIVLSRALSAQAVLVLMVGCTLDPRVQYLCEPDGTCIQPGRVCRDDPDGNRYCVIPDGSGGGSPTGGGSTGGGMTGGGMTGGGMTGGGMTGGGMTGGGTGGGTTGGGTGGGGPSCACLPTDGCGFKPGCGDTFCDYCSPGTQCGVTVPNQCARVNLCEPDGGWCWENPLPQGNDLRGVFHQSARRTFIVGDAATVMFFDGERLSLMPTELPRTAQLNAVHGNATRVYAVGDDGVIAALEGDRWVQENSGTTSDLYSVFVFPDGTAYAAGARATVRKREPGPCPGAAICWNEVGTEAAPSIDFGPISGDPSTLDVRLATRGGPSIYVLRFGQFRLESTFSGLEFRALTFVEGRSWAGVTRANFVLTLDGGFDGPTRQVGIPFNAGSAVVPGGDEAALYLAGVNGRILRVPLDGGPTDDIDTRFGQELYAIDLIGPRHVMAVGDDGSWVACLPPCTDLSHARELTTLDFRGVSHLCGLDDTTMFAATQALCDARTCTLRASRRETSTAARWVYLDNRVFDGGSPLPDGGARVRDGAGCALDEPSRRAFHLDVTGNYLSHSFNTVGSNATSAGRFADLDGGILGVWSATDVAFLLTPGAIVEGRWSDGSIAGIGAFDAGGPRALSGIIRRGNADVYAVGESGFAYRATDAGQPAAKLTSGNRATMTAVYGTVRPDGGGLWVAGGEGGAIWRRTHLGNETFTVEDAGFTEDIRTAYLSPSGQAFLRVPQGQLLTGFPYLGQWTLMPVPVSDELRALTGVPMADGGLALYSGGSQGKILRLETGLPYARP